MRGFRIGILTLAAAVILSACNRDAPAPQDVAEDAAQVAAPETPADIAPSTQLIVRTVESVMVTRPQDAPASVIIQASGTVPSTGWSEPKLVPVDGADPAIRSFNFVATSPASAESEALTEAVEAQLQIETLPADVKTIRIVSATNAVSALLP